jgi:hypothetical protein
MYKKKTVYVGLGALWFQDSARDLGTHILWTGTTVLRQTSAQEDMLFLFRKNLPYQPFWHVCELVGHIQDSFDL